MGETVAINDPFDAEDISKGNPSILWVNRNLPQHAIMGLMQADSVNGDHKLVRNYLWENKGKFELSRDKEAHVLFINPDVQSV